MDRALAPFSVVLGIIVLYVVICYIISKRVVDKHVERHHKAKIIRRGRKGSDQYRPHTDATKREEKPDPAMQPRIHRRIADYVRLHRRR